MDKTSGAHGVGAANKVNGVDHVRQVEQAGKIEKAQLNKVSPHALSDRAVAQVGKAGESHGVQMMSKMMSDLEKGQGVLDKLIAGGLSGKKFNSTELLALQAGMYKYTQELELTGKVVEKATSGLKDTLKTQV